MKMMMAPATANELISTPKRERSPSPAKRKATRMANEISATFSGPILAPLLRRSMMMGSEPVMSMMAKSTMNALMISLKLKLISDDFVPQKYN